MGKTCCFYCNRKCKGDVLKVGEKYFHKECFTCKVCHKRMETSGFFCKEDSFYCLDDYKRYCASLCFSCNEKIIGEVVTALGHTFHKECFKCSICLRCFAPGDRVSMRMSEFLCNECCGPPIYDKEVLSTKLNLEEASTKNQTLENGHHLELFDNKNRELRSSTLPIQKKNISNQLSSSERPLSNNTIQTINTSSNGRNRENGENELESSIRSSQTITPKHFHLPPGTTRSWSSSLGSKTHPLALSATNINRSFSSSSQKINIDNTKSPDTVKNMSSYPSGDMSVEKTESPLDKEDWPAAPAIGVVMSERNRRKVQNPTVEALSGGTTPRIRKPRSTSQYTERECASQNSTLNRLRLSEVLDKSITDSPINSKTDEIQKKRNDIPNDPISASRTPSAICEPLAPPRYEDHSETSPSRNDEYFRSGNRHLGYSMEYINSTNRSFISENNVPGYRRSLRNSNIELQSESSNDFNGLKKTGIHSTITDYKSMAGNNKYSSDHFIKESGSLGRTKAIPYDQLRVSTLKMIRHINKSNLEAYLNDEEFIKLFQLTKPAFYQLPEWKRNDLKKKVDLF